MYNIYGRKYYPGTRNKNDSFPFPPQLSPILVEKKQSHPSYSRKLRGSTSEGISKDPSARSIRKKTVEYSIPRAISIPSRWFPRRDRVNENIILVVRGLVRSVHPILFPFCIPRPSSLRSASGPSFRQLLSVPTSSPEIILLPILVHLPPLHCQPPRFSTLFFRPFSFPFFSFFFPKRTKIATLVTFQRSLPTTRIERFGARIGNWFEARRTFARNGSIDGLLIKTYFNRLWENERGHVSTPSTNFIIVANWHTIRKTLPIIKRCITVAQWPTDDRTGRLLSPLI